MISDSDFLALVENVYSFHTKRAPGIPIAVQMVLLAKERLGKVKMGAVAETQVCLSDAIQFLTGCTIGNKYLILLDKIGRYALTLYDRSNGKGIRVSVSMAKIDAEKMPETYKFFLRKRSPEVQTDNEARAASAKIIVDEFIANGRDIFKIEEVQVKCYEKPPIASASICDKCGESFLIEDKENICRVCSGKDDYYTLR
ncbi:MAG: FmdE family protein [Candidatus Rifleibacteriota bacterium]